MELSRGEAGGQQEEDGSERQPGGREGGREGLRVYIEEERRKGGGEGARRGILPRERPDHHGREGEEEEGEEKEGAG